MQKGARQVEKCVMSRQLAANCMLIRRPWPDLPCPIGGNGRPDWGLAVPMALVAVMMLGWLRGTPIVPAEALASKMPVSTAVAAVSRDGLPVSSPEGKQSPAKLPGSSDGPQAIPAYPVQAPAEIRSDHDSARAQAIVKRTENFLADKNSRGYTLQLASLPSMEPLSGYIELIEKHVDSSTIFAHDRTYNGKSSVAVYVGQYASEQEARRALHQLPEALKNNQPIVRTWARIRQEPKP
jgi:septal ring-binding cell division protein DamX